MESGVRGGAADLRQLYERDPAWFVGDEAPSGPFPLLVKLLATSQRLSVQVHPDDQQARRLEGTAGGKHEAWVILEAAPEACLYLGLAPGVNLAQLEAALRGGREDEISALLRRVPAREGDVFDIPPGTLHAIGPGLVLMEVQQPSDTTFRVFDWGRTGLDGHPRTLHLDHGLAVIAPDARPEPQPPVSSLSGMDGEILLQTRSFRIERWRVQGRLDVPVSELLTCVCVAGSGMVSSHLDAPQPVAKGSSCVVPRGVSMVSFDGRDLELLVALPPA